MSLDALYPGRATPLARADFAGALANNSKNPKGIPNDRGQETYSAKKPLSLKPDLLPRGQASGPPSLVSPFSSRKGAGRNLQLARLEMRLAPTTPYTTPKLDALHMDREIDTRRGNRPTTDYTKLKEGIREFDVQAFTNALSFLRPLAEKGNSSAQFYLGIMFDQGNDVIKNHKIATQWYAKAAKQGHSGAQYNLGIAYARGIGVKKSPSKAVEWWRKAALSGSVDAQFNLGLFYVRGSAEQIKWWTMAADNGDKQAQFNLGVSYMKGSAKVPQDLCKAAEYLKEAAAQGHDQAKQVLKQLKPFLSRNRRCGTTRPAAQQPKTPSWWPSRN